MRGFDVLEERVLAARIRAERELPEAPPVAAPDELQTVKGHIAQLSAFKDTLDTVRAQATTAARVEMLQCLQEALQNAASSSAQRPSQAAVAAALSANVSRLQVEQSQGVAVLQKLVRDKAVASSATLAAADAALVAARADCAACSRRLAAAKSAHDCFAQCGEDASIAALDAAQPPPNLPAPYKALEARLRALVHEHGNVAAEHAGAQLAANGPTEAYPCELAGQPVDLRTPDRSDTAADGAGCSRDARAEGSKRAAKTQYQQQQQQQTRGEKDSAEASAEAREDQKRALLEDVRLQNGSVVKEVRVEGGTAVTEAFVALARSSFIEPKNKLQEGSLLVVAFGIAPLTQASSMVWYPYTQSGMPDRVLDDLGVGKNGSLWLGDLQVPTDLPVRYDRKVLDEIDDYRVAAALQIKVCWIFNAKGIFE